MLTSLRVLSLRVNNLSGPIPSDFSNLKYLTRLLLNSNSFSGNIPSSFSYLPYLIALRLANNNFSGYLPDMKNAQDLTMFNVSYNKLVGPIPPSLSSFSESAFFNNVFLCGPPLNVACNASFSGPTSYVKPDNTSTGRRAIFGIYSGSTMLFVAQNLLNEQ
ncbi:putative non-specific serine/threonine protein kinase [Helianthus annuus]|uniref:Non-specific serine/threonine protein kinase n=1 Tax=Helianthus annuus TaxID=4232 RepID=A0A251TPW9_HELAN|nr:putative non-specific serine/threonine protein kinase [Helianthus annuus]KAJ0523998.1 putative non-specific serine/threonine protein kinase [Helianthus annuus]KAJ0531655.1 putative non-specific serine/threonine protein kinase [Helianthus annuus]KAJ0698496.1 putative non-specific serine/threonine protein kinase [Helianthus annuus]KAJ0701844.1 putative non-specific serine/threonine protein kinase [Helianthus annuus]